MGFRVPELHPMESRGRDTNSLLGVNPGWVSAPDNLRLGASSPAIGVGANLASTGILSLLIDRDGGNRSTGAWDIGAYRFQSGGSALNPPGSLTAIVTRVP